KIPLAVAVGIELIRVRHVRAVVAAVRPAVAVRILLPGVVVERAVVADVTEAVAIAVELAGVRHVRTVVAGVADAVAVSIGLAGGDESAESAADRIAGGLRPDGAALVRVAATAGQELNGESMGGVAVNLDEVAVRWRNVVLLVVVLAPGDHHLVGLQADH